MSKPLDLFAAWTPFSLLDEEALEKASPNGGDEEPMVGKIGGVITTEVVDQQGEVVLSKGMNFDYFLKHGWFNHEHQGGPENVLGEPTRVYSVTHGGKQGVCVEGNLYLHKPRARAVYNTALAMQKSGSTRRLGYSVEGQVLQRDPANRNRVLQSRVLNVAITAHPVNPDARLEVLAKAASAVGYGTPSTGGGSFAPLVSQSIDGQPAIMAEATPSALLAQAQAGRITAEQLARKLSRIFKISQTKARAIAERIARAVGM